MEKLDWKWEVRMANLMIVMILGMMAAGAMIVGGLWDFFSWQDGVLITQDGMASWMSILFGIIPLRVYHRNRGWRVRDYGQGLGMSWRPFVGALLVVLAVNELAELSIESLSWRWEEMGVPIVDPWMAKVGGPFDPLLFLYSMVLAPVFEEIVYRGMLVRVLAKRSKVLAIIVSGVVFGLMHGNIPQIVFTTVLGFFLAYVMIETGSLVAPILLHMGNNLYAEFFNEVIVSRWGEQTGFWTVYQSVAPFVAFVFFLVGLVTVVVYFHDKRTRREGMGVESRGEIQVLPDAPFHTRGAFSGYFSQPSTYLLLAFFALDIYGRL